MNNHSSLIQRIGLWLVIGLRMIVGLVVMKAGYDLAAGRLRYDISLENDPITPLFIILMGAYFCFSSLFRWLFSDSDEQETETRE
ncbi:hypothetical protein [Desulfogranum mediterraneum]|uniref:hypothetical protein n=1 Tax=Desulfogranum mediterraneum TaxID=160661 RepID=UPI000412CAD5|nr:hypothetical protein [Desulfogranum mediterraneum]